MTTSDDRATLAVFSQKLRMLTVAWLDLRSDNFFNPLCDDEICSIPPANPIVPHLVYGCA
jgi:hypothetical protein